MWWGLLLIRTLALWHRWGAHSALEPGKTPTPHLLPAVLTFAIVIRCRRLRMFGKCPCPRRCHTHTRDRPQMEGYLSRPCLGSPYTSHFPCSRSMGHPRGRDNRSRLCSRRQPYMCPLNLVVYVVHFFFGDGFPPQLGFCFFFSFAPFCWPWCLSRLPFVEPVDCFLRSCGMTLVCVYLAGRTC